MLGAALFDKPAFKNLIVNGLVLASDGEKMSKRLKNCPGEARLRSVRFAVGLPSLFGRVREPVRARVRVVSGVGRRLASTAATG